MIACVFCTCFGTDTVMSVCCCLRALPHLTLRVNICVTLLLRRQAVPAFGENILGLITSWKGSRLAGGIFFIACHLSVEVGSLFRLRLEEDKLLAGLLDNRVLTFVEKLLATAIAKRLFRREVNTTSRGLLVSLFEARPWLVHLTAPGGSRQIWQTHIWDLSPSGGPFLWGRFLKDLSKTVSSPWGFAKFS